MIAFKDVLGIIASDLSFTHQIGSDERFRSMKLTCWLIRRAIADKGFRAIVTYRLKNYAYLTKKNRLLRLFMFLDGILNGIEISHKAEIGLHLSLPHAQCIVIGNSVIGNDVTIYQGVSLGATWGKEKDGQRYPMIGDGVRISSWAQVIGPVCIGNNSIIGANAVVINDVPENCVAVGVPAKVKRRDTAL